MVSSNKAAALGYIEHGTGQHQSNTVYDNACISPAVTTIQGGRNATDKDFGD